MRRASLRAQLEILSALAAEARGQVEISLWARRRWIRPNFTRVAAHPHMTFTAPHRQDLPRIYAEAHFVWAIDYFEAGGNSDWLLPNRL